jgi:hypothetical protein
VLRSFDGTRRAGPARSRCPARATPTCLRRRLGPRRRRPDIAGDFDGNGTPDLGGPNVNPYAAAGRLARRHRHGPHWRAPSRRSPRRASRWWAAAASRTSRSAPRTARCWLGADPAGDGTAGGDGADQRGPFGAHTSCAAGERYGLQIIGPSLDSRASAHGVRVPARRLSWRRRPAPGAQPHQRRGVVQRLDGRTMPGRFRVHASVRRGRPLGGGGTTATGATAMRLRRLLASIGAAPSARPGRSAPGRSAPVIRPATARLHCVTCARFEA